MTNKQDTRAAQEQVLKNFFARHVRSNVGQILAPKLVWKEAKDFPLEKIKDRFIIPDFDRATSSAHINRIAISIMNNEFFDNIIRVVRLENGKWLVIDGQHRLAALWRCHTLFNLGKYDLLLGIYEREDDARLIYRKINSGLRLRIQDMMKSLDDGTYLFFKKMRPWCSHDDARETVTFYDAINLLYSSKNESVIKNVNINNLQESLKAVTDEQYKIVQQFLEMMYSISRDTFTNYYAIVVLRNLFKLHGQFNLTSSELLKVSNTIINNKALPIRSHRNDGQKEVYLYALKQISKIREK